MRWVVVLLVMGVLLANCGGGEALPTVSVLPTAAPLPTETLVPTATATITDTPEATATVAIEFDDATSEALYNDIMALDTVVSIEQFWTSHPISDLPYIYAEITVKEGNISQSLASEILNIAQTYYADMGTLDLFQSDGLNIPVNYYWEAGSLELQVSEMFASATQQAESD